LLNIINASSGKKVFSTIHFFIRTILKENKVIFALKFKNKIKNNLSLGRWTKFHFALCLFNTTAARTQTETSYSWHNIIFDHKLRID